jgi:hypothetical protein
MRVINQKSSGLDESMRIIVHFISQLVQHANVTGPQVLVFPRLATKKGPVSTDSCTVIVIAFFERGLLSYFIQIEHIGPAMRTERKQTRDVIGGIGNM